MKETMIKNLEERIAYLELEIKKGDEPNMNNLDGWSMQGLREKLREAQVELVKMKYILSDDNDQN
tara:strand:+ start:278 stop:472 length:195 start_codon:yes stop_codon:yes gene_type:complete